jgi:hypothetical protein
MFLRMMASRNVLPEIGDSKKEQNTHKLFNPQLTDLDQLFLSKHNDPPYITPADYQRQYFAATFTKTALNFLFDHECCHIFSGHVGYLVTSTGIDSMDEQEGTFAIIDGLNRQTLEMDADAYAAYHGILHMQWIMDAADMLPKEKAAFFPVGKMRFPTGCLQCMRYLGCLDIKNMMLAGCPAIPILHQVSGSG